MANGQWPDYVNLRHPAPKRHTDEGGGATHRYTRPILSRAYRQNGSPLPHRPYSGWRVLVWRPFQKGGMWRYWFFARSFIANPGGIKIKHATLSML